MAALMTRVGRRNWNCRCCTPWKPDHGAIRQREKRQDTADLQAELHGPSMLDDVPYPKRVWDKYFDDEDEAPFIPFGQWFEYHQNA